MGMKFRVLIYEAPASDLERVNSLIETAKEERERQKYDRIDVYTGVVKESGPYGGTKEPQDIYKMLVMVPVANADGTEVGPPPWYAIPGEYGAQGYLKEHFLCELQVDLSKGMSFDDSAQRLVAALTENLKTLK